MKFLSWLFKTKEQVAVEQQMAAPVVVNDDDDWSSESVAGFEALNRVQLLEREYKAMSVRLATVERLLTLTLPATVEEWRGE